MTAFHWTTVAVWAAAATGASAQDATKIEALEKRIAELEAKQPKDAAGKDAGGGDMKWNDFSLGGSRFQIYGFLRTDAYYDDSRPNSVTLPSFIKSEDQTAPAGFRAPVNENDFTISAKLTRFGINFTGPKISGLGDPALTGKLETDFKANGDKSIRQRLMEVDRLVNIRVADQLTAGNVILVQATSDVVVLVEGEPLQTIQWDIEGGFRINFKAFAIQVPLIRDDPDGRSGIQHMHA